MSVMLPRGITGFCSARDQPLPTTDFRLFKATCYELAREFGLMQPQREASCFIICNAYYWYLGFLEALPPKPSTFVNIADWAAWFVRRQPTWRMLSRDELTSTAEGAACRNLEKPELDQVKYWKPVSIGEIVFNYWD